MTLKQALQTYATRARRQYCAGKWLIYLPLILMVGAVSFTVFDLTLGYGLIAAAIVVLLLLIMAIVSIHVGPKAKRLKGHYNLNNSADIFNQKYAALEYSAQLALKTPDKLNVLQRMQLARIEESFDVFSQQNLKLLFPKLMAFNVNQWCKIIGTWLLLVSVLTIIAFAHRAEESSQPYHVGPFRYYAEVKVTPPEYAQLPTYIYSIRNLTVLEGSVVTWRVSTDNDYKEQMNPKLQFADQLLPLEHQRIIDTYKAEVFAMQDFYDEEEWLAIMRKKSVKQDKWTISQTINQTGFYQLIGDKLEGEDLALYAIAVTNDQPPSIKMLSPTTTLVTFASNEQPQLTTKALVSDDFGLGEVKLVASLAKGSGEAVKFRDLNVAFDEIKAHQKSQGQDENHNNSEEKSQIVQKTWDFKALNMEPGDELYFSIHATDNKMPKAQTTRSSTVIVRWLDGDQQLIGADGLLLTYMPEYFRSQRQIIIETEQLIADMPQLSRTQIDDISVSLGQSQQDLKLRYGQYLGDEVGEGPGEQVDYIGGAVEHGNDSHEGHEHSSYNQEQSHSHEKRESHSDKQNALSDQLQQAAVEHDHQAHTNQSAQTALGSDIAVETAFAHTHEEVHVGEVSTQNPKAMMKKAVSFMWQAELHLMLSEPQKALPFELQAYKYLKLAKQSERIYVKRLGFEPPPVSEEKRLTGELDDIESYQVEKQLELSDSDNQLFSQTFALISRLKTNTNGKSDISPWQQQRLKRLKNRLTELAQTRPALINYALTIEKILINKDIDLADCDDCIALLSAKLWQLIQMPVSEPIKRRAEYLDGDDLVTDFFDVLNSKRTP